MREFIIHGRGGQGAQTAGNLLARAYFACGHQVQAFATYGGARRGTPVSSFLRVADQPIRLRCDIERADAILCFDASLLEGRLLATAHAQTRILVNSAHSVAHYAQLLPGYQVMPLDGLAISRQHGLGRIVNSALLGAFARMLTDVPSCCALRYSPLGRPGVLMAPPLAVLAHVLAEQLPELCDENVAACAEGFRRVDEQLSALAL